MSLTTIHTIRSYSSYSFLILIASLLFYNCSQDAKHPVESNISNKADHLFHEFHEFKLRINPIEATKGGDPRYNDKIANYISDEYQQELIDRYSFFLNEIEKLKSEVIDPAQLLSLKTMQWDCNIKLEGLKNPLVTVASPMYDLPTFKLMPITQITSLQLYFSQLAAGRSVHPFNTTKDYNDWLVRINEYLKWMDTAIENMRIGMDQEIVLPKVLVERIISQLDPFINSSVEDHLFYSPIKLMPDQFTTIDRDPITDAYKQIIANKVIPKYKELSAFLKIEYLPKARETSGLGALKNGLETYNYLIRLHTSTDLTPDEIFELGKAEVNRISIEMEKVKNQLNFKGDLKSFLDHIRSNPDLMPFSDPQQVIENFNKIHIRMMPQLSNLFNIEPKAGFEVRRTEAFREQSASAEYVPGTKDGSRPGTFYVPIPDVTSHNIFKDEALFLHEAIPGHHFQLSLQQENTDLPDFLHAEGMGVFVEGWALYAESLGEELGLYSNPYQLFGMLSMEMHRAIRLVVDSGIHSKGWTREEAIQYSMNHEADSKSSITAEIERYMATPGQALSYKIGQLKIQELRALSEKTLGDSFDIKEFHSQVLSSGSLPMSLLESKIKNWISSFEN